jgi:methyl acetate hydrolase
MLTIPGGYSYSFQDKNLFRYTGYDTENDEIAGSTKPLSFPLTFEPGTSHGYGMGVQLVAVFIERFTGKTLEKYFSEHIFHPLGLKSATFFVSPDLRKRLITLHRREEDGTLHPIPQIFPPLLKEKSEDVVCSGEGGLVTTISDYSRK